MTSSSKPAIPPSLASRLGNVRQQLPYLHRTLRLVWAAARGWLVLWMVLLVVRGALPVAVVYLTRAVVNELANVLGKGFSWHAISPLVLVGGSMAAVLALSQILTTAIDRVRTAQNEYVSDHIKALIQRKSVEVDLLFHDFHTFHDHLHRARVDAQYRPVSLVDNAGNLVQHGITLMAMAAVIAPYGAWVPVVLLLSTLPAFIVLLRYSAKRYLWELEHTPGTRRLRYYDDVLLGRPHATELRLFGLGSHFIELYRLLRVRHRRSWLEFGFRESLATLAAGLAASAVTAGALAWIVWRAINGHASLGDVALFQQAFSRGQGLLRSLLVNVGEIYRNMLFLSDLFSFLSLEPKIVEPAEPLPAPRQLTRGIRCRSLTFCYPGNEAPVFEDFDCEIPAGSVTALVGVNGAGKSTLLKLLCRLYEPDGGGIELDGVDIRRFPVQELRRQFAVLSQEPARYYESARDNVALGDFDSERPDGSIESACVAAGIDEVVTAWPKGYDTQLGKLFAEGRELSVGQWQRIALARTFFRSAPIILLDEPTSAMDSWAEADWMMRFRAHVEDRTALVVTHRFTTAARADRVLVLHEGRIVEAGSHRELLATGGRYAESWHQQVGFDPPPTAL